MRKLAEYWRNPYFDSQKKWKNVVIPSFIVFFILLLLQPFGLSEVKNHKLLIILGFGLVTLLCSCVSIYLLPLIFKKAYSREGWTLGNYIANLLLLICLISIGNFLYITGLNDWTFNVKLLIYFVFNTFVIAIFPVVYMTMQNQKDRLKHHLQEAIQINEWIKNRKESLVVSSALLTLNGNTRESVSFAPEQFLFLEVEGNYIKVHYESEGKEITGMLRTTIKQVEEELAAYHTIVRCHRAFMVSLNRVSRVVGNSQGYRLCINGSFEEIPVSRRYAKAIHQRLEELNA
nr:LytTR family DNA-binding domain-containing protein [uncultured Bacteroides sp.]